MPDDHLLAPELLAIGLDHRDKEWCSRLSLTEASRHRLLADLTSDAGFSEAVVLATCNRVEVYAVPSVASLPITPAAQLTSRLLDAAGQDPDLRPPVRHYDAHSAPRHLTRVACGLESMVLGETEILGQVGASVDAAADATSIGPRLRLLFQHAVRAGRRARTETAISRHALSVGALAVNHAESLVPDLASAPLAVVGTGRGARLILAALKTRNAQGVTIISRDAGRATREAESWGASAAVWPEIAEVLSRVRVAFSAADGDGIIDRQIVTGATESHSDGDDLLLVDIAAPPNVDRAVETLPRVTVRRIADLGVESERALAHRRREVPDVEKIVKKEYRAFLAAQRELRSHPVIAALRQHADRVRERELARAVRELNGAKDDDVVHEQMDRLSRSIINQLLHRPTAKLRAAAENGSWDEHARVVRSIFELDRTSAE